MTDEELVKCAVEHLLECELLESNGWTKSDLERLENLKGDDYIIVFI